MLAVPRATIRLDPASRGVSPLTDVDRAPSDPGGRPTWLGADASLVRPGVGFPVSPKTSSNIGPTFGVWAGYALERGDRTVRWELMVHANPEATVLTAPIGVSATWGDVFAPGVYLHLGIPILGYPFPGAHTGAQVAFEPGERLRANLRLGYELAHGVHMKCGRCPQAADHWVDVEVLVGLAF